MSRAHLLSSVASATVLVFLRLLGMQACSCGASSLMERPFNETKEQLLAMGNFQVHVV
jgi:hypothetical protein